MKPTEKNPAIDKLLTQIFGVNRQESIGKEVCPICRKPYGPFRDTLSRKEARISGLCQECQDKTFNEE